MYYQEVNLKADKNMPLCKLWTKVYMQLHLMFATVKHTYGDKGRIGVSLPEYNNSGFGRKIRLFANSKEVLITADLVNALSCYLKHIDISDIKPVPNKPLKYVMYCRYHPDGSPEQKARRFAKRHEGVTFDKAVTFMKTRQNKVLPYTRMYSMTTSQRFNLIIDKCESKTQNNSDEYTSYGLSFNGSTVPEW